jgi:DNA-binding XRE family transcriptional regulator
MVRRQAKLETVAMCCRQYRLADPTADGLRPSGDANSRGGMEIQAVIGANLRRLRKQRGLSRRRLACLAGVERSTLQALERGATTPSIGMLWKLARELGVPCTAFIEAEAPQRTHDARLGGSGLLAIG